MEKPRVHMHEQKGELNPYGEVQIPKVPKPPLQCTPPPPPSQPKFEKPIDSGKSQDIGGQSAHCF